MLRVVNNLEKSQEFSKVVKGLDKLGEFCCVAKADSCQLYIQVLQLNVIPLKYFCFLLANLHYVCQGNFHFCCEKARENGIKIDLLPILFFLCLSEFSDFHFHFLFSDNILKHSYLCYCIMPLCMSYSFGRFTFYKFYQALCNALRFFLIISLKKQVLKLVVNQ